MNAFNPQLITDPRLNPNASIPMDIPPPLPPAPIAPPVTPQPVFIPVPMKTPTPQKKALSVSSAVARKAQGIYPAEQQAKQKMIDNSKPARPAPTGAWGTAE